MAGISKRGDSYLISVNNGIDRNGKRIIQTITFKPTATSPKKIEREVQDFARDFEEKVKSGKYYSGEKITFEEFFELWYEDWAKLNLTVRCQEDYRRRIENRILPTLGKMKIAQIKPIHIQRIISGMTLEGKAPKTTKYVFTCLNSVMRYAYRLEVIEQNPCDRVELPKQKKSNELHYFTLDQAKTFLRALEMSYTVEYKPHNRKLSITGEEYSVPGYVEERSIPTQYQSYFSLAIFGGFRRGEICALTWNDIDFEKRTVSISKAFSKTHEEQIVKDPKTASGIREIVLPQTCFDKLKQWKIEQKILSLQHGSEWRGYVGEDFDRNYVFIQLNNPNCGLPIDVDTPSHKFKEILAMYNATVEREEDKLPEIRLHDLRHTSATLLLSEGIDVETVAKRLGHSQASVTLNVYGHALEAKDQTASQMLEAMFA